MNRIEFVNFDRIEWCCADDGITPESLAAAVGVSSDRMAEVMQGKSGLTFNQLRRMADHFGRGVLFFLEPGSVESATVHTAQFRTLARQKPDLSPRLKALIERVERQRDIFLSLRNDLLDDAHAVRFNAPSVSDTSVVAVAKAARTWLGLGDANSFDSYRAAVEAKNILVFRTNGFAGKWQIAKESPVLGFALYDVACPVIVIKKMVFEASQAFTLMHELGHVLLHRASWIDDDNDFQETQGKEQDANMFAGLVLVPDHFLNEIDDDQRPEDVTGFHPWLTPQRKKWGVSSEVILRRLMDVGRLPRDTYLAYRQWRLANPYVVNEQGGSRVYRHREPKHIFGDRYVRTVLDALSTQHITLSKASGYLDGLKVADVHELERHYARS